MSTAMAGSIRFPVGPGSATRASREAGLWPPDGTGAILSHDNLAVDIDRDGKRDLVSIMDKHGVLTLVWHRGRPDAAVGRTQGPRRHQSRMPRGDRRGRPRRRRGHRPHPRRSLARKLRRPGRARSSTGLRLRQGRPLGHPPDRPARLEDLDRDGDLDLIQAEGDVLNGRVAWFENRDGKGRRWRPHPSSRLPVTTRISTRSVSPTSTTTAISTSSPEAAR